MERPSTSDESFKRFLDELQKQNNRAFATQLLQVKYEREIAKEDDDKREEQLDELIALFKKVEKDDDDKREEQLDSIIDSSKNSELIFERIEKAILGLNDCCDDEEECCDETHALLNEANKTLVSLKKAITGFDKNFENSHLVSVISAIGANTTKLLDEQLKEISLTRKLTEGSVEYDKEAAQYRNTSGRDVENLVSGKTSKPGGFIDFETARDTLSGQSERARQNNKVNLITSVTTTRPGDATEQSFDNSDTYEKRVRPRRERARGTGVQQEDKKVSGGKKEEEKRLTGVEIKPDDRTWSEFFKDIKSIFGFKGGGNEAYSATKGRYAGEFVKAGKGTEQEGMLDYERRIKKEKEADQAKKFGFEPIEDPEFIEKIKSSADTKNTPGAELKPTPAEANPESDNIESPAEIQNKMVKEDLELTKQSKTIFEQQLFELRSIREALGGAKPSGKGEPGPKPQEAVPEREKEDSGPGLLDMLPGKGTLGKIGKGAAALGSKAVKFLSGKGGAVLGGALAVGAGAYTAYQGYTAAEDSKQAKMEDIQSKLSSGEINEKQAAELRKEAGNTATVEKSEAVGEGTGMAAGGLAGMKAGAMIGTAFGGPIGTVVGGALGGAAGMFLGSKAGKAVGGVVGKGIASVKNFFGMGEGEGVGDKTKEAVSGGQPMTRDRKFFESIKDLPPGEQAQKLEEYKAQVTKETNSARSGQVAEAAVRAMLADYNKSKKEGASTQPSQKGAAGAPTVEVSKAGEGSTTPATGKTASIDLKTEPRRIGDEGWSPGEQLSDKQMSIIGYGKNMGRTYSAEVEAQYAKQKPGLDMANMAAENQAMRDSASSQPGGSMIVNNVSNGGGAAPNFVPMKANPRPESSLTRYQDRVAAY